MTPMALLVDYGGVLTDHGEGETVEPPLVGFVRRVRAVGIRTAIVSNIDDATVLRWGEPFERTVTSGAVGLVKPDPGFYLTAARWLGVEPSGCVVVDDLRRNVEGAVEAGMVGVHHRLVRETVAELEILFAVDAGR